ncbi:hypothetical protein SAY86_003396 [Trapa natans]|uniref:Uncharacterized protein n=1 Tax=Trapa natans TaxID=22666 RepID=A0AAN7ME46_TRANT|nr:hypothetical protein SAY86_003396 [Trapa natans]
MQLCSITLVTALLILLRTATRITHRAQSIACLASKWNVSAALDFSTAWKDSDSPDPQDAATRGDPFPLSIIEEPPYVGNSGNEGVLDNYQLAPVYARSIISFQKRLALVTYFENNIAGITVYGFALDRGSLCTIFGIELSLVLWLLGKTINII